ncbi:MAG TPA: formyltransferase family protein [Candidatus Solibacter sp.]|nr:formyltransferase family protein [Candidatus Solibacter sp.]
MRILFLGNNWLGWQSLKWLRERGDEIVGVAVHPDKRAKYRSEIVREITGSCELFDGSQLKDPGVLQRIRSVHADIAVSVLFGYILGTDFLESFPLGCINLHPALLPHNRGAYPNVWSIVDKTPSGVTLHYVDAGVDTGDVIAQKEVPVKLTDTGETLYRRLETEALELFKTTWPLICDGTASRTRQRPGEVGSHRVRDVEMIDKIDLQKSYVAEDLINVIRARTFPPYRGAYFIQGAKKIYLQLELKEEELEGEGGIEL